jgi:autophagy-related protein 5
LPLLLPRLHAFFSPLLIADAESITVHEGYFSYDGVPLKWHLPLGLLYDMYVMSIRDSSLEKSASTSSLPFKLTLHYSPDEASTNVNSITPDPITMHDSFINSVKEADFLRSGTAKPIMTLPAADSKALWSSTQENDVATYAKIHQTLLPAPGQMRNIPLRLYLPSSSEQDPTAAQMRILQSHVPPVVIGSSPSTAAQARAVGGAQPQTLGTALHNLLPGLFPSRRTPIIARPVLHGAQVPLSASLEELARWACYADGWLSMVVSIDS